jgi:hypothetical protein
LQKLPSQSRHHRLPRNVFEQSTNVMVVPPR